LGGALARRGNKKMMIRPVLFVRDATEKDIPALTTIKETSALHHDRLQDAKRFAFRYLLLEQNANLIGFACLVFTRPESWSDAHDTSHLPQIVDLQIAPQLRGKGFGSYLIRELEQIVVQQRYQELFLAVDPINNLRAHRLYRRLGYQQLQKKPYLKHWEFVDSDGILHQGDDWIVDMVKRF
jgi:ribosomal protein S18 acetylase RimI-like enzyme